MYLNVFVRKYICPVLVLTPYLNFFDHIFVINENIKSQYVTYYLFIFSDVLSCQNVCCGECVECNFKIFTNTERIIKHTLRGGCLTMFFKKETIFPRAWYFAAKYP
jgi:hypothetical protein